MTDPFEDAVRAFEQFKASTKRAEERDFDGMREQIASLSAVAQSPDRSVTVTAGPGGAITNISLNDAALRQGPHSLASTIMSTLNQAVAAAARQQAAIVQDTMGEDFPVLDKVLETQAEMLGTTVGALKAEHGLDRAEAAPRVQDENNMVTSVRNMVSEQPSSYSAPQPAQQPRRAPRPADSGDDDFSQGNVFNQGTDW